jgi:hypothetical protein
MKGARCIPAVTHGAVLDDEAEGLNDKSVDTKDED